MSSRPENSNSRALGALYGVSLGPGDPQLLTRRAWHLLQDAACWTYPVRNKKSDSYALSIALAAGLELPAQHHALVFPMTHDVEILQGYWLRAAEIVLSILQQGIDVMFLVEGDASTYSTFGHLAKTLRGLACDCRIETIPGVSSYHAAAARLELPLADVDDTVAIVPAGYGIDTLEKLLPQVDSLVLLKVKPLLDDIIVWLEKRALVKHAAFVEKAGSDEERVFRDLSELKNQKVNYLSLIIVRNPNRTRGDLIRGCRKKSQRISDATLVGEFTD